MNEQVLRRRIRFWTWVFIVGLVISGATAIPLVSEVDALAHTFGVSKGDSPASRPVAYWLLQVQTALHDVNDRYPFLFYGTDWLAFGHFVIAIAFNGVLRDPIRNQWIFTFGMISCALVLPYALVFGGTRGIPTWWRLIDCSFGVIGLIPLVLARKGARDLERIGPSSG